MRYKERWCGNIVSTHSRAEAAAWKQTVEVKRGDVSTHSRAEAAATTPSYLVAPVREVSTHSRAEAAART